MSQPSCFIAMPLTTTDEAKALHQGDSDHFVHVLDHLFVPAVEAAGFTAIKPIMSGGDVIQGEIIKHLETADLVLCDISGHNPNVFFELGIRTALDRPVALVRDDKTDKLPFDTSIVNTHTYHSALTPWTLPQETQKLTKHLSDTHRNTPDKNALWGFFGLTKRASERSPSENPLEAKVDLIMGQLSALRGESDRHAIGRSNPSPTEKLTNAIFEAAARYGTDIVVSETPRGTHIGVLKGPVPPQFATALENLAELYERSIEVTSNEGLLWFQGKH